MKGDAGLLSDSRAVQWRLRSESDDGRIRWQLGTGTYRIGNDPQCDLVIGGPSDDPCRVDLRVDDDGVVVESSGYGVSTAGRPVDGPVRLSDGARLEFATEVLVLERLADSPSPPRSHSSGGILGAATLGFLHGAGEEVAYAAGAVVIRRGERHDSFYAVLDGEVALVLSDGDARRRPLASLGPGATFAAESVLSKRGAAADAVAVTATRLLRYPASALAEALGESPSLREKLLGGFARDFHDAISDVVDLLHGTDVVARLVQGDDESVGMIACSARMRTVARRIEACAASRAPVLVVGDAGTGKTLAARQLHLASARANGPLIVVDCERLAADRAAELVLGAGHDERRGVPRISGGIHLAHGGTLVLRHLEALPASVQEAVALALEVAAVRVPGEFPDTRVVATASAVARTGDDDTRVVPRLAERFVEVIHIPRLADRPRDIVPLAQAMLAGLGSDAPELTESGCHALLQFDYRNRNVAELHDVVVVAARCAEEGWIRAEHVFSERGDEALPAGMDVTSSGLVRWLVERRGITLLRAATGLGFAAVVVVGLALPATIAARSANALIWAAWEPVVFSLFLLAGPVWCAVCPLSVAGRLVQRRWGLRRPPPGWIVDHGPWMTVAGFAVIVWVERAYHMTGRPQAAALLLGGLVAASVVACLLYAREVWCRHLCPLGRLAVVLAPASPLQLTAHRGVCASTCRSHDCYKGTSSVPGCSVFHHPLESSQAHHCKLCLDCLQSCPHGSVRIQLRSPLVAITALDQRASGDAMFALSVSLLGLVLLAARAIPGLARPGPFAVALAAAALGGLVLHRWLLARAGAEERRHVVRVLFAIMIVGWGALVADQVANVPPLAGAYLVIPMSAAAAGSGVQLAVLPTLQIVILVVAAILALVAMARIRAEDERNGDRRAGRSAWWGALATIVGGTVVAIGLVWLASGPL